MADAAPPSSGPVAFALVFAVAHIFLWPVLVAALLWWAVPSWLSVPAVAAYASWVALSSHSHDGKMYNFNFARFWPICHGYFPTRLLLWDGKRYAADATPEASALYPATGGATKIFALFPHGPFPSGAAMLPPQLCKWPDIARRLRIGVHWSIFALPLVREFFLMLGAIHADRRTLLKQLQHGNHIMLLPGGVAEQLIIPKPGTEPIVLHKRKGFVKLALETGSDLVPVFVFGERDGWRVPSWIMPLSRVLKKAFGVGVPLPIGRFGTFMPKAGAVTIVVGKPIAVPKYTPPAPAPTGSNSSANNNHSNSHSLDHTAEGRAAVDALHATFTKALQELYDEHAAALGYGNRRLVIL